MRHLPQLVVAILSTFAAVSASASAHVDEIARCTGVRLSKFVGPLGVDQQWPIAPSLPSDSDLSQPITLANAKDHLISDGYVVTLRVDATMRRAYVIQRGGFAGIQTVFGPLPVASCAAPAGP